MRVVLAVSALVSTMLLTGVALAHPSDCDECRGRDRPTPAQVMKERFSQATSHREALPDRRPHAEKPSIIKERPQDIGADPRMNPKGAAKAGKQPQVATSDKAGRGIVKPMQRINPVAREAVVAHANKMGGAHGGRPDTENPNKNKAIEAQTAGLKLKLPAIQRPVNARPIISPGVGAAQGCSAQGKCLNGDAPRAVGTPTSESWQRTPSAIEKVQGESSKIRPSSPNTMNPSSTPKGNVVMSAPEQNSATTHKSSSPSDQNSGSARGSRSDLP
ncbi:MAG: hypothetical protein HY898_08340 [Deltaproteobacteria bacterium]|nr:hypothetical protein [Deltaproteobacteria bacterium]